MANYPNVHYSIFKEGTEKKYNYICFSELRYNDTPDQVKFNCWVDDDLDLDQINFYAKFLKKILNGKIFDYEIKEEEKRNIIVWDLSSKELYHSQILMYLTAMRIPQEFPEIIIELFKSKDEKIDKLFDIFMQIHLDCCSSKIKLKYESFFGHGLCAPYDYKNHKCPNLEKFKLKLTKKLNSVESYFTDKD